MTESPELPSSDKNAEATAAQSGRPSTPAKAASAASVTGLEEWSLYIQQWRGLWAGTTVPTYSLSEPPDGSIKDRDQKDLLLLLDVATRQLATFETQLEQIRQRSQFLFTTLLALAGFATVVGKAVIADDGTPALIARVVVAAAGAVLVSALLGAAGVIVNRKVMGILSAPWLTRQDGEWLPALAQDAVEAVHASHMAVANQLTYFRHAALLTIIGTMLLCSGWLIASW